VTYVEKDESCLWQGLVICFLFCELPITSDEPGHKPTDDENVSHSALMICEGSLIASDVWLAAYHQWTAWLMEEFTASCLSFWVEHVSRMSDEGLFV